MLKDLHNSPIIFWLLAVVAVGSALFAVYTFEITKPSRNITYREFFQTFSFPEEISENITIKSEKESFHPNPGYIKELYIWNDGNLEIEPSYVLQPIKINLPEDGKFIDLSVRNSDKNTTSYRIIDNSLEIKFEKLLPKAGFIIRYFSKSNAFNPSIEGLIADPIRGASRVGSPTTQIILPRLQKTETWYGDFFGVIFLPITSLGLIQLIHEQRPLSKFGKILKTITYYPFITMVIAITSLKLYDIFLTRPPFN